jgi:hypothetical protein
MASNWKMDRVFSEERESLRKPESLLREREREREIKIHLSGCNQA